MSLLPSLASTTAVTGRGSGGGGGGGGRKMGGDDSTEAVPAPPATAAKAGAELGVRKENGVAARVLAGTRGGVVSEFSTPGVSGTIGM